MLSASCGDDGNSGAGGLIAVASGESTVHTGGAVGVMSGQGIASTSGVVDTTIVSQCGSQGCEWLADVQLGHG